MKNVITRIHGQLGLKRFTMTRTWGKPPPSPLQYILQLSTGATSKWLFVTRFPNESLDIPTTWTLVTLGVHNFTRKPLITMRSKAKLQPSSRSFQRYVAHLLHVKKLSQFLTFNGQESNCQFDSRPFFDHNLCSRCPNQKCEPLLNM